jgi:hypothetical protein
LAGRCHFSPILAATTRVSLRMMESTPLCVLEDYIGLKSADLFLISIMSAGK